jgi:predicted protein tyrosine phosphatase
MTARIDMARKANRLAALKDLQALAAKLGLETEHTEYPEWRSITVYLRHPLANVMIDLDTVTENFMAHWNATLGTDIRFARNFTQSVNEHHRRKATTLIADWDAFKDELEDCFTAIIDSTAFLEHA